VIESSFDDNIIKTEVEACRDGVRAKLEVGPVRNPRPILPAIHPYFAVSPGGEYIISVGGLKFGAAELGGEAIICECQHSIVRVHLYGIGEVRINTTSNCSHVVLWSDQPSKYFCVEPVFGKPGSFAGLDGQVLERGDKFRAELGFEFTPK
jgi:galactose mutarotase-like enzyme